MCAGATLEEDFSENFLTFYKIFVIIYIEKMRKTQSERNGAYGIQ